jgi:hypothetical protein
MRLQRLTWLDHHSFSVYPEARLVDDRRIGVEGRRDAEKQLLEDTASLRRLPRKLTVSWYRNDIERPGIGLRCILEQLKKQVSRASVQARQNEQNAAFTTYTAALSQALAGVEKGYGLERWIAEPKALERIHDSPTGGVRRMNRDGAVVRNVAALH